MAAIHCSHISAAASFNGKVHMWGMCRGQNVLAPMETRFGSLDDVFSSSIYTTSVHIESGSDCGIVKCIAQKFNDSVSHLKHSTKSRLCNDDVMEFPPTSYSEYIRSDYCG